MKTSPNILFIMADQMAAPLLPLHDPRSALRMPHLSRLAERAVVFDSAYCNSPLCAPSRFTLVSGRLPTRIGAWDNAADFAADTPTYAHYLRKLGYRTALSGKMHFCGPDQLHGYEERLTSDIYPADYGWAVNWDEPEVRPSWYHNMSSVLQAGPCVRTNQLDFDEEVVFKARQYLYDHVRQHAGQPFCLTVSMTHPHDPYSIPASYWNLYRDEDIPLPRQRFAQEEQDPHSQRLLKVIDLWDKPLPEERIRAARRAYFGACSYVDAQIGALLATLEECGLADDTIVVFSGDHGDMLGERGLWYKMHWFEMAARVPLLVHAPARFAPRRIGASVSTVDLLPTLVELAGGQVDPRLPLEGRSLLPHLRDGSGHDEVIGEYTAEGTLSPLMMIRRGDYKFIYSEQDPACSTTCATTRRSARTSPPVRPIAERSRRSSTRPGDAGTSPRSPAPYSTASAADAWWPPRWREDGWPAGTTSRGSMPASSTCATISTWTISSAARASRNPEHEGTSMNRLPTCLLAATLFLGSASLYAEDPACARVRLADPGWSDIAVTNATAAFLLESLGYQVKIDTLSVPIIYGGLRDGQVDAFLGGWMPAHQDYHDKFVASGQVERLGRNLDGTRFTLAVPRYVWDAGVHRFEDLAAQGQRFNRKLYGIGSGAPANQSIQKMIDANQFGLGDWKLVESSEQAMLAELGRAEKRQRWLVFLGWTPHPMNIRHDLRYLEGGEQYFGDRGQVYTLARKGYAAQCPNPARLLANLRFDLDMENRLMSDALEGTATPASATRAWLKANPRVLEAWLQGVTSRDGGDALAAVRGQP